MLEIIELMLLTFHKCQILIPQEGKNLQIGPISCLVIWVARKCLFVKLKVNFLWIWNIDKGDTWVWNMEQYLNKVDVDWRYKEWEREGWLCIILPCHCGIMCTVPSGDKRRV